MGSYRQFSYRRFSDCESIQPHTFLFQFYKGVTCWASGFHIICFYPVSRSSRFSRQAPADGQLRTCYCRSLIGWFLLHMPEEPLFSIRGNFNTKHVSFLHPVAGWLVDAGSFPLRPIFPLGRKLQCYTLPHVEVSIINY